MKRKAHKAAKTNRRKIHPTWDAGDSFPIEPVPKSNIITSLLSAADTAFLIRQKTSPRLRAS